MRHVFFAALVTLISAAFWASSLDAEDWPQWRGPNRDGHSLEYEWNQSAGRAAFDAALAVVDAARAHPCGRLDGMVFPADTQLALDTKLHLQFLLSSDNRFVETFCKVVRHTDPPSGNDTDVLPYGIAVEFIGMVPQSL